MAEKTIESKLKKLNKVLEKFEEGEISLNESVGEYKKASKLVKEIKKELESIELEIKEISGGDDSDED